MFRSAILVQTEAVNGREFGNKLQGDFALAEMSAVLSPRRHYQSGMLSDPRNVKRVH